MTYKDPFKTFLNLIIIIVLLSFAVLMTVLFAQIGESSKACNEFGGKLSGSFNCIKHGVSYELESVSIFSLKKQVVRKAVDING